MDLTPSARHNGKREIQQKRRKRWEKKTKNGGFTSGNSRRRRQLWLRSARNRYD
jgi:hypothetical protein